MLLEILGAASVVLVVWFLARKDPEPLLGIYSQPGKWFLLKKYLFMLLLIIRKQQAKKKQQVQKDDPGYGMKSHNSIAEMECPQQLCSDELAIDCMYFSGLDAKGSFVILRIARRHGRKAEIWLSVNIPDVGFFQSPIHPDTNLYNVDSDAFNAGGLKFECVEPMKRWRVTFNGLLRKGMSSEWSPENVETVHAQLSLMWSAFTDPFDFDTDIYPSCMAEAIAREKWSRDFFDRLKKSHQTHYEQWGELWGTFSVEGQPENYLKLRGYRDHSYGVRDWHSFHRYAINFWYLEDGSAFHVNSISMPDTVSLLQCGYMSLPNADMHPVSWTDMNLLELGENRNPPKQYEFNFIAGGKKYHVRVVPQTVFLYNHHEDWRSVVFEQVASYEVNGIKGYGLFEFLYRRPRGSPVVPPEVFPALKELPPTDVSEKDALALTFTQPGCTNSGLVGGKGCQLALLSQLHSQKFLVPDGFCLTVKAFEIQLQNNEHLQQLVTQLHDTSCKNPDELQSFCTSVVKTFQTSPICGAVRNAVVTHLEQVFGADYSSASLAVRSSATGEDGTEMSAAGQMDTVLGVRGLDQILDAVSKCWASQFAFPAVSYRRLHGQSIELSSGVVIQRMVPASAAGVLFTCHPVTRNPGEMILNANYGLGESVVSGESQPDEIVISRSWDDKLTIQNKTVGAKKTQIKLTENGNTQEVIGGEGDARVCCLSDEVILKLGAIGVELEKRFASARDIEFAVDSSDAIHLLQARPITTLDHVTEYELMHEFDTALANDREFLTTANVQEMMPSAMTPLTLSVFFESIDWSGQKSFVDSGVQQRLHLPQKFNPCVSNQGFINMMVAGQLCDQKNSLGDLRTMQLALLGEVRDDFTIDDVKAYTGCLSLPRRILTAVRMVRRMVRSDSQMGRWEEFLLRNEIVDIEQDSVDSLYNDISNVVPLQGEVFADHMATSAKSALWSNLIMVIIAKNKPVWTREHFSDIATLLAKCEDVYSADVPSALQKLAAVIINSGSKDKFLNFTPDDAVRWLESADSGEAGVMFAEFLIRHGHRCIREAELREKSWRSEPTKVIKPLQAIVRTLQLMKDRQNVSHEISVDHIKTPTSAAARAIIRWILPRARKAVGAREYSKSLSIKLIDGLKKGYERLAELMVNESRLPDKDLIYFLTHREIGQVLKTRSGSLIARAQKRRQLLPKLMSLRFPRISFGRPQPIVDDDNGDVFRLTSSFKISGCPVSRGEVRGKAKVVTSIDAASEIQMGEILIVPFTDVGWSPYFPVISGLVTEIGGLLSHGAVVAREYGIPCVVNVARATVVFRSGDTVLLNGSAGTLEKLTVDSHAAV